ncbi:MAG: DUF2059 domain-containing protein [Deltaproteobacteria bacterium]|nr:DUF2059 domain-containing protein [Deltaproteobacteria bacterium]
MKRWVVIIVLLVFPAVAYSGELNKRHKVEALLVLTKIDTMVDSMYSQMDQIMKGMSRQLGIKPSEEEMFNKFMSRYVSIMRQEMNWEKMKGPMIDVYMKHYSDKEIQDMITFYKSETGKSMIEKMPEVMKDSMLISQSMMKDFVPKMESIFLEIKKEIEKEREKQK